MVNTSHGGAVLSKPLLMEGDPDDEYGEANVVTRLFRLLKNVRRGSDLTNFQLPAVFNIPKSQLQLFGESVYCVKKNMLRKCNTSPTPLERLTAVVAWTISTSRHLKFGTAPYNPVLGETHHASRGSLNVLLEQVSHHPPVSALHATDDVEKIDMVWCHYHIAKFYGSKVEAEVKGRRVLKLLNHGETYLIQVPNLFVKLFPPGIDWVGKMKVCCPETNLEANLTYSTSSFLGRGGGAHSVKGKIYNSSSSSTLVEVSGRWNSIITAKNIDTGKETVIYNAKEVIGGLSAPFVRDHQRVWRSESAVVWSEVNRCILAKDWDNANEAKKRVERTQRELAKTRLSEGHPWLAKHFSVSHSKEDGWTCSPLQKSAPPAPIIFSVDPVE